MRKTLFVHDGPLGTYDAEIYGIHYKNELVDRYSFFGEKVTFLMRSKALEVADLDKYSKIDHPDFNFLSIPNFKSIKSLHKKGKAKSIIQKAVKDHDVVVVRLPSAAGVIAFKEAKNLNKPVLVEFVACVYEALWNYDWRGMLLADYKFKQYQQLMKGATHTIYVTNKFLQSRYHSGGKSVGCSDVELQVMDEKVLATRLEKIKNTIKPLKLVTVAAIDVKYKGQADVIKAIAELKKSKVHFKYDIIGQGNPERLQALIDELDVNELVNIIGALPHKQIFKALEEIDLYIQPSKQEGLPRAVIEAMSMACPVIGTDVGGIPELLGKECIFPKGDVDALKSLLSKVDEDFLKVNAKLNFEKAKEYQKENLETKRKEFYNEFLRDNNLV